MLSEMTLVNVGCHGDNQLIQMKCLLGGGAVEIINTSCDPAGIRRFSSERCGEYL